MPKLKLFFWAPKFLCFWCHPKMANSLKTAPIWGLLDAKEIFSISLIFRENQAFEYRSLFNFSLMIKNFKCDFWPFSLWNLPNQAQIRIRREILRRIAIFLTNLRQKIFFAHFLAHFCHIFANFGQKFNENQLKWP